MRDYIFFYINSERVEVRGADCFLMLADFIRKKRGLSGTKIVCAEGDCGACTVLLGTPSEPETDLNYRPMNSCILPVFNCDGVHILTVEGLGERGHLHAIQEAIVTSHATQCGFCTPGIVMALAGIFEPLCAIEA